jgi:hypothetical protein
LNATTPTTVPQHTQPTPQQDAALLPQRVLLFLDFDGVLHPAKCGRRVRYLVDDVVTGRFDPRSLGAFCGERQERLVQVLDDNPQVDIVLTSMWRTLHPERPLDWLVALLHPQIAARVIGATPDLGLVDDFGNPQREGRLKEVQAFLGALPARERYTRRWLALDDEEYLYFDPQHRAAAYFYKEQSSDRTYQRLSWSCSTAPEDETVLILDGDQGFTPGAARMLRKALALASDQGPATKGRASEVYQTSEFDVPLFIDKLIAFLSNRAAVEVRIPTSAWPAARDAIVGRLSKFETVHLLTIDAATTALPPEKALCAILSQQWRSPAEPANLSGWAEAWEKFSEQERKRGCIIVLEGLERLPSDMARESWVTAINRWKNAFETQLGDSILMTLPLIITPDAPAAPRTGRRSRVDKTFCFEFPASEALPYCY